MTKITKQERAYRAQLRKSYKRREYRLHWNGRTDRQKAMTIFTNIYDRRLNYQRWRAREPEIAPKQVGAEFLRRKIARIRELLNREPIAA